MFCQGHDTPNTSRSGVLIICLVPALRSLHLRVVPEIAFLFGLTWMVRDDLVLRARWFGDFGTSEAVFLCSRMYWLCHPGKNLILLCKT